MKKQNIKAICRCLDCDYLEEFWDDLMFEEIDHDDPYDPMQWQCALNGKTVSNKKTIPKWCRLPDFKEIDAGKKK